MCATADPVMKRPSESSQESDGLCVGRVRLPCLSRFIRPSDQDTWGNLCGKVGGFAFEMQLSITEKGQYAVAYGLSCKKDCHELHTTGDLCKKALLPTTETPTQVFGCFRPNHS